jgi:enoyl-CoA hydratase/carnithine racemase
MDARPYRAITAEHDGFVATITLNVPERRNPLGPQMVNELLYALDDARDDPSIRVIVLTGAGDTFSAGGDLKQMSGGDGLAPKGDYADLLMRFTALRKPTVARVRGYAMGGGLGLVASCDFAVASDTAVLGTPEVRRGLFPMMIMAVLARVVPRRQLMSMMLLGERLTADEALAYGLVSHVVPDAELDAKTTELTSKLAAQSPTALRHGLEAFHFQTDLALADALPGLRDRLFELLGSEDAREGLSAFFEKRAPSWTGR